MSNNTPQHSRDQRDDSTMLSHDETSSQKHSPVRMSSHHNTAAAESQVAMAEYGGTQAKAMPTATSSSTQHKDADVPFPSAQANTQQRVSSGATKHTTSGQGDPTETERPYYGLSSSFFKRQSVGRDGGDSPTLGHSFSSRFDSEGAEAPMPSEHSHGPRASNDVNENRSSYSDGSHETRALDASATGATALSSSKKKKNKKKKKGQGQSGYSGSDEGATSGSTSGALGQQVHLVHSAGPHHAVIPHHIKRSTHAGNNGTSDQGGMIGIGDQGGTIGIGEQGGMTGTGDQGGMIGIGEQGAMIGIGDQGGPSGHGDQGGMIGIGDRNNHTMAAPAHSIHYAGTHSHHKAPLSQDAPPELEKALHFEASHATAFPSTKRDSSDDTAHRHGQGDREHTSSERMNEPVVSIGELPRHERFSGPLEYLEDNSGGGTGTETRADSKHRGTHASAAKVGAGLAGLGTAAAAAGQFGSPMTHHDPSAIQKQDHAPQGSFFTQPDTFNHKTASSSHANDSRQSGQRAGATYSPSAPPNQDHHDHHKASRIETIHEPYHGSSSYTGPSRQSQASERIETIHQPYTGPEPGSTGANSDVGGAASAPSGSQTLNKRTTWFGFGVPVKEKKVKPPTKARPLSFGYGYKDHAKAYKADWKQRSKAESSSDSPVLASMAPQHSGSEAGPSAHSSSPSHDHTAQAQKSMQTASMPKKGHYLTHSKSLSAKSPSSPRVMPGFIPANMRRSHLPPPQSAMTASSTISAVGSPIVTPSSSLQIQSVTPQRPGAGNSPQIHSFSPSQDRPVHVEETWHTSNMPRGHYLTHSKSLNSKRQSTPREIPSFAPPSLRRSHVPTPPPQPSAAHHMNSRSTRAMAATGAAAVPLSLAAASSLGRNSHHSTAAALPTPKTDVSLYDEEQGSYPRGEKDVHDNPAPSAHPSKVTELSVSSSSDHRLAPLVMASVPAYDTAAETSRLASSETSPIHNQLRRPSTAAMPKKPNADLSLYPEEEGAYSRREEDRHENPAPSEHPTGVTEEIQLDEKDMHAHHDAHLTMTDKVKDALGGLHMPSLSSKNSKKKKKKKAAATAAVTATGAAGVAAALRSMTPEPDDTQDEGSISARKVEPVSTTPSTILVTDKATTTHLTTKNAGSASAAASAAVAAGAAASHNRKMSRLLRKGSSGAEKTADDDELAVKSAGTHVSKDSETAEAMIPASDFAVHSQGVQDKTAVVEDDDDMEAAVIRAGEQAAMTVQTTSTKAIVFADEAEGSTSRHPGDIAVIESTTTTAVIESTDEEVEDEDGKKKKVKKNKVPLKTRISKATSSSAAAVSSAASHSAAAVSSAASHSAAAVTAAAVSSAAAVSAAAVAYKERQPVGEKPVLLLTEDDVPQPPMPQVSHKLALTEDDVDKPVVPTVSHLLTLTEDDVEKPTVPVVSHRLTLTEDDVDKPVPTLSAPPVLRLTEDDVVKPDPSSASHPVVPKVQPKLVSTSMIKVTTAPRPMIPEHPVKGKDLKFPKVVMPVVVMPKMPHMRAPKMPHVSKPKMFKFSAPKMPHVRMPTLRRKSKVAPEVVKTTTVVQTVPVVAATVAAVAKPEPVRTFVVNPPAAAHASSSKAVPTFTSKLVEPIEQVPVAPEPIKTFVLDTPPAVQAAPKAVPVITSKLVEPRVEPPKTEWVQPSAAYVPPPPQPEVEASHLQQTTPAPTSDNGESVLWVKKTYTTHHYYDSQDEDELDEYGYRKDRDISRYIAPMRSNSGRYTSADGPKTDRLDYNLRNHTRPAGYQGQPVQKQQVYNFQPDQKQDQQQQHRFLGNNMGYNTQPRQSAF
ncbi:hypothetical protein BGZ70_008578 [Mortierella alpina]|uniref:Uncharacterized protein n=1 Tax=Mortierella alpina TaxID=64518 RepID=A0A9P6J3M7_MORAP|nr:hypothetical protein BGZ70_008578 [Mortierella alpina]